MSGRIVLFGATGFTGSLTARALVGQGVKPVLAARNRQRVEALADELGGLESAVVDVERPASISNLLGEGDVFISTVGPFVRWGEPAVRAAIASGAHYFDSTGEAPFVRQIFERYGPEAHAAGSGLVTAFGYDSVPGNLTGALALQAAGPAGVRLDVAYFMSGLVGPKAMSGGSRASAAAALASPGFAFIGGRLVTERGARRVRRFNVDGTARPTISFGASEHFALPRLHPTLRDVGTWLGWFGALSRPFQVMSAVTEGTLKIPGARRLIEAAVGKVTGSSGGPSAESRAAVRSTVLAVASDGAGRALAEVRLDGVNCYDYTADILAWAGRRTLEGGLRGTGALGPADAFSLDDLEAGSAQAGMVRVDP